MTTHLNHYWSVLTKNVAIDKITNNLILGQVVEEISFNFPGQEKEKLNAAAGDGQPVVLPVELYLTSYMEAESPNTKADLRIEFFSPENKKLTSTDISVNFGANKRGRNLHKFQGLPFVGFGKYKMRVIHLVGATEVLLAEMPLYMNQRI